MNQDIRVQISGKTFNVRLAGPQALGPREASLDGRPVSFQMDSPPEASRDFCIRIGAARYVVRIEPEVDSAESGVVRIGGRALPYAFDAPLGARPGAALRGDTDPVIRCHMPGLLVRLAVREGDEVKPGDLLAVLEAMKMQNEIRAKRKGRVRKVHGAPGATFEAGMPLVTLDPL